MSTRSHSQAQTTSETSHTSPAKGLLQHSHQQPEETNEQEKVKIPSFPGSTFNGDFSQVPVHNTPRIQPKLRLGQPGDRFEEEADQVARQVMRAPNPMMRIENSSPPGNHNYLQERLQKLELGQEMEEEHPARMLQPRMMPPGHLGDLISRYGEKLQRQEVTEEDESEEILQPKIIPGYGDKLQRQEITEEEDTEEILQAKTVEGKIGTVNPNIESNLNISRGKGQPLPKPTRDFMESRFGADFSGVRVHTDSSAVQMNKELRAQAFTYGEDIYYGAGKSPGNDELTAHELTHTIQQTGGVQRKRNKLQLKANESSHEIVKPSQTLTQRETDNFEKLKPKNQLQNKEQKQPQIESKQELKPKKIKIPSRNKKSNQSVTAKKPEKAKTPAREKKIAGEQNKKKQNLEKPQLQTPDVSQTDPSAALAAISNLPPVKLQSALGGVSAAVTTTVGKHREALATNPPTGETPMGAKLPASEVSKVALDDNPKAVEKKPEGENKPVTEPQSLPAETIPPQVQTPSPAVQGNEQGKLSESEMEKMQASISQMPVQDPGAREISAGTPPQLELVGNADPQKAEEQKAALETSIAQTQAQGQQALAQLMGENTIEHTLPQQTLKAQIANSGGTNPGGAVKAVTAEGGNGEMLEAISVFAQQEKGGEIQAAAVKAQGDLAARKQEHTAKVAEEKAKSHQDMEQLKLNNAQLQAQEKSKAQAEVQQLRGEWSEEQESLIQESDTQANNLVDEGIKEIDTNKLEGETEAQKEIEKGEQDAAKERQKGEEQAAAERKKGEKESSGFFGWLASKAKAFFNRIKNAIKKAFEAARAAIRRAIETAKKLAAKTIEKVRQAIVTTIRRVGNALIAIGDKLLAKWPSLQQKWQNSIQKRVQQAESAVNKLAQDLNDGIQKGLDLLGKGLDATLGILEQGMLGVVSIYEGVVMGAIKFGEGVAKALGAFAVLAKDVAANPGEWISNLGAAIADGIKNHLWAAFQEQVQVWFNQKLEAVLGLGTAIWKILTEGGISIAEIGKMAWSAVKESLPMIIMGVLLERLVSMIVPAAGAVLAIIQGLQAAWGTVGQIIQAFKRFMTFLKAVKTGNAGPQFGALLASAAIVLLEFITNFIIVKIAKAAQKVGSKLKGLAKSFRKKGKGKKGKNKENKEKKDKDKNKANQEKLDRAVRELQPKITRMLNKGVPSIQLRAKLAIWRVKYRLKKLSLEKEGVNHFKIVAQVNPKANVLKTFTPTQREIIRIVHKVGEDMLNSPEAKKSARALAQQREQGFGKDKAKPLLTESGAGNLGAILDLRKYVSNRKQHKPEYVQVGNHVTSERHIRKAITLGTNFVKLSHRGSTYPAIKKNLDGIHKYIAQHPHWKNKNKKKIEGLIAISIWNMARGKKIPTSLVDENTKKHFKIEPTQHFAELNRLIFHAEGSRGDGATAFSPMLVEMIGKGEMSFEEAFNAQGDDYDNKHGAGGLFPPSQKGAVKAMERVAEDSKAKEEEIKENNHKNNNNKDVLVREKEQARRQIEFIERWISMKMKEKKLNFKNKNDFERFVKEEFEQELRKSMNNFFGISI